MPKSLLCSLRGKRDFELVFKEGVSLASQYLVVYARLNQLSVNRLGLSVSKKIGIAVLRNRVRRLLRESMRKILEEIPLTCDFVIIAKKPAANGKLDDFIRDIRRFLYKLQKANTGIS